MRTRRLDTVGTPIPGERVREFGLDQQQRARPLRNVSKEDAMCNPPHMGRVASAHLANFEIEADR